MPNEVYTTEIRYDLVSNNQTEQDFRGVIRGLDEQTEAAKRTRTAMEGVRNVQADLSRTAGLATDPLSATGQRRAPAAFQIRTESEYTAIERQHQSLSKRITLLKAAGAETENYERQLRRLDAALSTSSAIGIAEAREARLTQERNTPPPLPAATAPKTQPWMRNRLLGTQVAQGAGEIASALGVPGVGMMMYGSTLAAAGSISMAITTLREAHQQLWQIANTEDLMNNGVKAFDMHIREAATSIESTHRVWEHTFGFIKEDIAKAATSLETFINEIDFNLKNTLSNIQMMEKAKTAVMGAFGAPPAAIHAVEHQSRQEQVEAERNARAARIKGLYDEAGIRSQEVASETAKAEILNEDLKKNAAAKHKSDVMLWAMTQRNEQLAKNLGLPPDASQEAVAERERMETSWWSPSVLGLSLLNLPTAWQFRRNARNQFNALRQGGNIAESQFHQGQLLDKQGRLILSDLDRAKGKAAEADGAVEKSLQEAGDAQRREPEIRKAEDIRLRSQKTIDRASEIHGQGGIPLSMNFNDEILNVLKSIDRRLDSDQMA